jgi:hypothetical protein
MRITGILFCGCFFFDCRLVLGSFLLLLEVGLLLIPMVILMVRHVNERTHVHRILTELSGTQRALLEPYAVPAKSFRRA